MDEEERRASEEYIQQLLAEEEQQQEEQRRRHDDDERLARLLSNQLVRASITRYYLKAHRLHPLGPLRVVLTGPGRFLSSKSPLVLTSSPSLGYRLTKFVFLLQNPAEVTPAKKKEVVIGQMDKWVFFTWRCSSDLGDDDDGDDDCVCAAGS